jgi:hypothetical protein
MLFAAATATLAGPSTGSGLVNRAAAVLRTHLFPFPLAGVLTRDRILV